MSSVGSDGNPAWRSRVDGSSAGFGGDPQSVDYFDYPLPDDRIAQTPAEPRDSARLLVARTRQPEGDWSIDDRQVADLADEVCSGDVVVLNNTRVWPARLNLTKNTGGRVEVLLLEPAIELGAAEETWWSLVGSSGKVRDGTVLYLGSEPVVEVGAHDGSGRRRVTLVAPDVMDRAGTVPLPPYIHHRLDDDDRYQTVFADQPGSVAAPTAGLHLTPQLLDRLGQKGAEVVTVELRVGLGTFRPVKAQQIADHHMHSEWYQVKGPVWDRIRSAPRVLAVGTTVVRTLESVAMSGQLSGRTELFIRRGYQWKVVDRLLTNFHVPRSSLLVLVDGFIGDRWQSIYRHALENDYRFLSFGDAMLVDRTQ